MAGFPRRIITKALLWVNKMFLLVEALERYGKKADYSIRYGIPTSFIAGRKVNIYGQGTLSVGGGSYIGDYSAIQVSHGYSVAIGASVAISHNVRMYTSGRNTRSFVAGISAQYDFGSIQIGDNVWIGANVMILHDVKIVDNVVIGANSVVTRSILESGVYAGCPAKRLKSFE